MADSTQNPYLALLQQEQGPPSWAQVLQHIGNLGFGLASGFGQAAATGQPTMAAIGPGLMLGNQMNAQAAHQAEQERMKRLELQFKAQEHEDKRAEMLRKEKQLQLLAGQYGPSSGTTPGFQVAPPQPSLMGPNGTAQPAQPGPDLKTAGAPLANYLVTQHGLSPLAASTVVGNLYQESGFNPSATGDSGSAFGMAQWRLDRQTGLRNFAATQNKPVTDPQVQIDYLVSEMKGGDMGAQRAWAGLQQAKTPEQANAAMMHFFRPAGYTPANPTGGHGYGQRVANTRALLPQGGPGDSTYAPVPTLPDPNEAPAVAPGPAPRPGLGPRATAVPGGPVTQSGAPIDPNAPPPPFMQPSAPPAPAGVPLAQGGGEGEVVLPRLGLPFPAPPPAAAAPGSVPFPTLPPQAPPPQAPPPQAQAPPGGPPPAAPAPSTLGPPPQLNLPQQAVLTAEQATRLQNLVRAGQPAEAAAEYKGILQTQQQEATKRYEQTYDQWKHQQARGEKDAWVPIDLKDPKNAQMFPNLDPTRLYQRNRGTGQITEVGSAPRDQFEVVTPQQAQMELGQAYVPTVAYQRNKNTGKIEPIKTGPDTQVNIDQKGETEFSKEMGKVDAKRFADIIQAEGTMNDMASKLGFALEQFKQTYTGPGAESANAFYKTLGAFGFEEAAKKANAADAAMAVVSQMKPAMRAPGTGSSSDRDMDTFARALPSLLNLPDGNERIGAYFQRMADRATRIRELAQEHSDGGKVPLTRTGFDKAVKELGPLFTADEVKEMTALGKTKVPPPPAGFTVTTPGQATPVPPPPAGFTVRP